MVIALTGVTGNMGQAALSQVVKLEGVDKIKVLVLPEDKRVKKLRKTYGKRIEIILGNLADKESCRKLVDGADYVVNMAAVIPPHSDKFPQKAVECNQVGVDTLVSTIEAQEKQAKLIHISTMALYGNRTSKHPWGQVGDPLLISPFDIYSATKMRGEFRVLESSIKDFAVLRQTAMLHHNMLSDNMSDGLMFHTCFNAPLEWTTAHDSGVLIANILKKDMEKRVEGFWRKCFNIGGGIKNCVTGYDTLNDGFKLIGGSTKDFFDPNYNSLRNFHGLWFYDSDKLEKLFHYQTQTVEDFWKELGDSHKYFKLAKIVPKKLIRKFAIQRLLKDDNSPWHWVKHNDIPRINAYFGGIENYKKIPKKWADFPLLIENKDESGKKISYSELRNKKKAALIDYKFDINGAPTIADLRNVAKAHGGKLLSRKYDDLYDQLEWENSEGEKFTARAYTILFAGHWYNRTYKENVWYFDHLAKTDEIYAQIWYDSHDKDKNKIYYYDENFVAKEK